ncbi:vacuolar protein sorting-associated protein 51 homolog isoform X2 [Latimeria chalumnae]|uniref:vacuolar protein sorting-associated protein 51 homolog isoform X2 n=1 Tax=Latimeria chalumnae TaxID=7897 RepID=UPI00313CB531
MAAAVGEEQAGPGAAGSEAARKRRAHGMLKLYYGISEEGPAGEKGGRDPLDPTDINGAHFNPEVYLTKLRKECSLTQLMDCETDMVKQIRALDSDMQTLVYENYNKFISATDTIRKMKNDFKKMEDEMDCLATNMAAITEFSARISGTLQDQHQQITKLSGVHTLLRKLQFLFELPARLNKCVELQAYSQAVRYYGKARSVLHQYQHMPSFQGIQNDCQKIMSELAQRLREKFRDGGSSAKDLAECVELLLQLEEPAEELCDEFLSHAQSKLQEDLASLEAELGTTPGPGAGAAPLTDILEFTDKGCNGFVSNICLVIASYQDLFIKRLSHGALGSENVSQMAQAKLTAFVNQLMAQYFSLVERRIQLEKGVGDNSLLVRALDRFHRRLQAVSKLLPTSNVATEGTEIVVRAAKERIRQYLLALQSFYMDCLTDVRQSLAAPRLMGKDSPNLAELLSTISASILNQIKSILTYVHLFTAKDITFSNKPYFKGQFCSQGVREGLIVGFIKYICQTARQFCETTGDKGGSTPPALLLLLSRLCLDYETSTISYILTLTDEQFLVQVGLLYEEGVRKAHSSDSSKRTFSVYSSSRMQTRYAPSYTPSAPMDTNLLSNIQKLFSERIDIFSPVEFNKVSVLTGIIKISLKTFLECVRLRTFGRYGLQQIQVDCYYLQLYLWRFVSDENLVHFLLDEIVGSTAHRCLDPITMEQSVIEVICERG